VSRLPFDLLEGIEIDEEMYDTIKAAAERTGALDEAARILSIGRKSKKTLLYKLKNKGFTSEAAEYAVNLLERKWYLCDKSTCRDTAEMLVRTKHYGRMRIISYLCAHGFAREDAGDAVRELDNDVLHDALKYNIDRKFPDIDTMQAAERRKAVQSLMRLGFSTEEIIKEVKNRADRR
jgi:SOS response regulatory protein OraA/RecX